MSARRVPGSPPTFAQDETNRPEAMAVKGTHPRISRPYADVGHPRRMKRPPLSRVA
jgi:hypothetical protein